MIYLSPFMQAFAQVPDLSVWYGPDSYMGANIKELFIQMTKMTDEEVAAIHPKHNVNTIRSLLPRLYYYQVRSLACFEKLRKTPLYLQLLCSIYMFLFIFIIL